jgi:nicotinate-nucleotide--dimethylbenzimidazole phosphoribosyltransferase
VVVFAADHGICAQGVSAFPQVVTGEMVRNFSRGGAAICVLSRQQGAQLEVVNVGTVTALESLPGVIDARVCAGSADFSQAQALTSEQLTAALQVGKEAAERAHARGAQVFIAGEMGIGNTSSAAALACVLLDCSVADMAGRGTGLDDVGLQHKITVLENALKLHDLNASSDPLHIMQCVGGLEIAAIAGAYLRAAQLGLVVLVDGFITTAAALWACAVQSALKDYLLCAHQSAEGAHSKMLAGLNARAILQLDMRLGEGSGAGLALAVLQNACALHNQMATFATAGVSEQ